MGIGTLCNISEMQLRRQRQISPRSTLLLITFYLVQKCIDQMVLQGDYHLLNILIRYGDIKGEIIHTVMQLLACMINV